VSTKIKRKEQESAYFIQIVTRITHASPPRLALPVPPSARCRRAGRLLISAHRAVRPGQPSELQGARLLPGACCNIHLSAICANSSQLRTQTQAFILPADNRKSTPALVTYQTALHPSIRRHTHKSTHIHTGSRLFPACRHGYARTRT